MFQQRIFIIRHGERVDNVFGTDWIERCFDKEGIYRPETINHPLSLPNRSCIKDFLNDSPITRIGSHQAYLLGTGLKTILQNRQYKLYTSPALRSIQTSMEILKGIGDTTTKISIDPCLYEWPKWSPLGMPNFISSHDLSLCKEFNVDTNYEPKTQIQDIDPEETVETFYNRSYEWINGILCDEKTKDIIIVAHGSSLDAFSKELTSGKPRNRTEMFNLYKKNQGGIPYLGVCIVEKECETSSWKIMDPHPNNLNVIHGVNKSFCPVNAFL